MKTNVNQFPIRALLFDLDGTVVDNSEAHYRAWQELGAKFGKTISRDEYATHYLGRNTRQVVTTIWNEQFDDAALRDLYKQKLTMYRSVLPQYGRIVKGFEVLHSWARLHGLPVGLVTNATPESRQATLEVFGLNEAFDCIVGVDHGLPLKPDPAMYHHAAAVLGIQDQDCVIFEDSPVGLVAAKRAGMSAVGITTHHDSSGLARAVFTIDDYDQLYLVSQNDGRHMIGKK